MTPDEAYVWLAKRAETLPPDAFQTRLWQRRWKLADLYRRLAADWIQNEVLWLPQRLKDNLPSARPSIVLAYCDYLSLCCFRSVLGVASRQSEKGSPQEASHFATAYSILISFAISERETSAPPASAFSPDFTTYRYGGAEKYVLFEERAPAHKVPEHLLLAEEVASILTGEAPEPFATLAVAIQVFKLDLDAGAIFDLAIFDKTPDREERVRVHKMVEDSLMKLLATGTPGNS